MKLQRLLLIASMAAVSFSCGNSNNNNNGDWVSKNQFVNGRTGCVAFVLNGLAYVGCGFDGKTYYNDMYTYDPKLDIWQEIDTIPGQPRENGVAFATTSYGYVGAGYNGMTPSNINGSQWYNDFYQYNPATQSWVAIPVCPFPNNEGRQYAVGFGIPKYNIGEVIGGWDGDYLYKDNYTWVESGLGAGTWSKDNDFKGVAREGAVSWVYNDKAYVVTGIGNTVNTTDFWVYDYSQPLGYRWTSNRPIGGVTDQSYDAGYTIERAYGVAWAGINQGVPKGYVTWGQNGGNLTSTWEYDYPTDLWSIKTPFPQGLGRIGGVAVSINDTGYLGLGASSIAAGVSYSDWTQFYPSLPYNPDDYTGNQ
jgi:hypothetical protein